MQLHIVLVAPARPENVGAAARAMKTMGFTSLRIVDSEAHLQPAARWVAHGAGDILDGVQTFATLEQALADVDFTVATTARSRARFHYYCTPQQLLGQLSERSQWVGQAALVFGREDSGLTNEELELADLLTGVPMQADYPSLNLGQAVMVYCYQLSELMKVSAPQEPVANEGQLKALRQRADGLLGALGVGDDQKLRDWLHQRLGTLQQRDTAMLHTLLHDIEKKLTK
ncbi:tRNA (cytidine/uridine-2'-O-)-methyltransferase TrmJ [Serratia quinivorans]|jgi:tRNA/rRNA methyltransferase|uniref:tRNA (cytidine/uridine-2'-O-)-methyltransferase TrmJ n=2 Tax=Serratia TaxID=613 RepID=A0ABV3UJF0_9GAMM|nr:MULTISPECIES: tRNA/rRNA methyltransferase [Serratia]MBV6693256.1 tRNA/rRNA methyltransferase [Serratia quinivorans]MCS4266718.1 tRNA/rRNA methyltransferase [Serratia sp. BIGb0163]CAI0949582.1 tRNA (cytidine/uridine-2'-O-)-methyltransferase TrmJ [Serratia quinivorans]CAI1035551.1 tRNA (cytidine/uridine-2'-O-)-methyltransferase TrmJ [Serratia quinivorans]CAI1058522.1 tRNA (cytidine/uridine-2'-O-)-methyltransferase TrmJ [Serratia quinivorans]